MPTKQRRTIKRYQRASSLHFPLYKMSLRNGIEEQLWMSRQDLEEQGNCQIILLIWKAKQNPHMVADELLCQEGLAGTKAAMHKQHLHGRVIKWKRNKWPHHKKSACEIWKATSGRAREISKLVLSSERYAWNK